MVTRGGGVRGLGAGPQGLRDQQSKVSPVRSRENRLYVYTSSTEGDRGRRNGLQGDSGLG